MHLVFKLGAGGMENGVVNLSNRLPRDRFASHICTYEPQGSLEDRLNGDRAVVFCEPRRSGRDFTLPLRLARQLRRRRIDVLHTHNYLTLLEGIAAARLARVRTLIHGEHGKVQDRLKHVLIQRVGWRMTSQVLAVSAALADRLATVVGFPRDRIKVVPNGVDTQRFRPSQTPKAELRRRLGLPADGLLIGMVARFFEFKDHAGVFRALAGLGDARAHLALAGTGPLEDELRRLAVELRISDRVHFLGELPRVDRLYNALDVLASNSSHNEGMSNVVLEAMSCGVPIVATRVAASPELLGEGSAGLLIPPRHPEALAEALRKFAQKPDLRSSLGRAGRRRVEDRYSISLMVESYGGLYTRLTGLSGQRPLERSRRVQATRAGW